MNKYSINFLDLFDWEKESDKDYIYLIEHQKNLEEEYYRWCKEEERKPAKVKVLTPIKKKDEIIDNSLPF